MNSTKIFKNWQIVWLENLHVKMKYTDSILLWLSVEILLLPLKMEIGLVYVDGYVCKDTKNHELQN